MKINLEDFAYEYGKAVSFPTASEGGRSFVLDNQLNHVSRKWAIDKVVFKGREEERCDYLIEVQANKTIYYWVELKGKDITKACRQVLSALGLINFVDNIRHEARIITTGTNKIDIRSLEYQRLSKLMLETGGKLLQYTNTKTEVIK